MKQILAWLILSVSCFAQSVVVIPRTRVNGVPATNLVTICSTNPGHGSCGSLVTTYTDATLTTPCSGSGGPLSGAGCSNPGNSDAAGNVVAFAAAGQYWCQTKESATAVADSIACAASSTGGGIPSGSAGGDLGSTYPNPTVVSVAHITTGVLPGANGGSVPIFSTAVTGTSMVTGGTNTVLVGPVSMVTPGADGAYRFVIQIIQTTAGSGGTCTTGDVAVDVSWKDPDTAQTYALSATSMMGLYTQGATALANTAAMASVANGISRNWNSVVKEFRAASGVAIQYQVYEPTNSNCTTPPVFAVRPALYYMGY